MLESSTIMLGVVIFIRVDDEDQLWSIGGGQAGSHQGHHQRSGINSPGRPDRSIPA